MERVVLTALGVKIVQLVTDDPDAARCPVCRVRVDLGQGLGADPPARPAVRRASSRWCSGASGAGGAAPRTVRGRSFTEQVAQVPAGMRTTTRLRTALAVAVEDGRDQSEVAAAHGVSWPTVQRAVVVHGAVELVEPEPTTVLGMDETRFGRPRWLPDGRRMTTAGSGGGARIRGRPGSSTSPVIRPCWGRSMAGPAPRCRPGWPPAPRRSGPGSRWW